MWTWAFVEYRLQNDTKMETEMMFSCLVFFFLTDSKRKFYYLSITSDDWISKCSKSNRINSLICICPAFYVHYLFCHEWIEKIELSPFWIHRSLTNLLATFLETMWNCRLYSCSDMMWYRIFDVNPHLDAILISLF